MAEEQQGHVKFFLKEGHVAECDYVLGLQDISIFVNGVK